MELREHHGEKASQGAEAAGEAPQVVDGAVVRGKDVVELARLYDPEVMLVTAPTPPGEGALLHARALAAAGLDSDTARVRTPDGIPERGELASLSLKGGDHAQAWVAYLEEATELFAALLGASSVGVRQIVSDGPQCPRFHVDRVVARGVLNVLGPCTEWLNEASLDRSRLGHAGGPDDATSGLVRQWDGLERAEPGTLAIFKGTAWPGASESAVVHRSPPADGNRRVLLTLDCLS